ncbi:MAG: polysaccharide deacetylase family protein [Bacteroidota bacterium]
MTIDDSPTKDMTSKVDYLRRFNIPAVFFCRGDLMERNASAVVDAIQKGFIIGNHSFHHPYFSNISIEQAYEEIDRTDRLIDQCYREAGQERPVKWFRFPFGDKGDLRRGKIFEPLEERGRRRGQILQAILRGMGYSQPAFEDIPYRYYREANLLKEVDWHWTFDTLEWSCLMGKPVLGIRDLSDVLARMREQAPGECRGMIEEEARWLGRPDAAEIILLHDFEETTDLFFPIIDAFLELGLEFQEFPTD